MKTRIYLIGSLLGLVSLALNAQDTSTRSEAVTEKCKQNNSVFYEFAKNKSYADALGPWQELYNDCPEYSKNIYKYGALILNWQMSQEKDPAKQAVILQKLMGLYDNRIKYFGDDATFPAPRILGLKAIDYINYATPSDPLKKDAYGWLAKSIDGLGQKTDAAFIQYYIQLSVNIYKKEPAHLDQLVQDYIKTNDILMTNAADSTNKNASVYAQTKVANDRMVAESKALRPETLDKIYASKVEENKKNLNYLVSVISLYKAVGGSESPVYFNAAVYAHNIQPTETSAVACAEMSRKKGEYAKTVDYLEQATKLSSSAKNKAAYQLQVASIYSDKLTNFSRAREAARNSLEFDPSQGEPYLLIGLLYTRTTGIYSDAVLAKTVYWVAVDKFNKAKQVDPGCAAKANEYISRYSRYFPAKDEVFFQPDLQSGKSFTVGGWIGESTICR
jgi:hypothetical protein